MQKKFCIATYILMALIVLIYLLDRYLVPLPAGYTGVTNQAEGLPAWAATVLGYCGGRLTDWLALCGPELNPWGGFFYRHFTSLLLQESLVHLALNLAALFVAGSFVERHLGPGAAALTFFLSGFVESFLSAPIFTFFNPPYMFDSPTAVTVGASSGVFGLMGAALAVCLCNRALFQEVELWEKIALGVYGVLMAWVLCLGLGTVRHNLSFLLGLGAVAGICAWVPPVRERVKAAMPMNVVEKEREEAEQRELEKWLELEHERQVKADLVNLLAEMKIDDQ